ncbi:MULTISPECIES: folate-binding protein YgfZ [unclassified Caulobacter]|jgi:folate-binding protein YgfZ|uniref:CAF17-like 4Fe-4S cluster assembly/insertion protein YgfZ n=1 Tax=unclassified Caulobacter TaxID=2648921 RepID=UPI0007846DA1|nr:MULTISPECIES: folate-binding protein YgfZ [unclassified Caulobacter]AZS22814.1 folate-binding protein [Caulobacter sp. FWC26]
MTAPLLARLASRAVIAVSGQDWRSFLQGLLTQDVETLAAGELRFGGLLTPQGKLLYDLFVVGTEDGALLDVATAHRDAILARLTMYRLRAKADLAASDRSVIAVFGGDISGAGLFADPRLPALGARAYDDRQTNADEDAYEAHRLALGVPGPADWGSETTYPIEANFDLLAGIDFKKGCFVGQETTSRMKRRGTIKNRMLPIVFDGPPPPFGAEVLAGELRAGEVLSGRDGRAMALLRLDRIDGAALSVDGRPVRVDRPEWMA